MPPPRKRFAVFVREAKTYLLVSVPRTVASSVISSPSSHCTPNQASSTSSLRPSSSAWDGGVSWVPLKVTSSSELIIAAEFSRSTFDSVAQFLQECGPFEQADEYSAVFGALLLDKMYFLVASKCELAMELPFGHTAQRILDTKWVGVALPNIPKLSIGERDSRRIKEFLGSPLQMGYYYSDEVDFSLPFPFTEPCGTSSSPDFHCDWSHHLRKPFSALGLEVSCSMLTRGFAGEHRLGLQDENGQILRMQLIGRQNHLNPGPRYYGRGLNHSNAAGNDHIYELVLWRYIDAPVVGGNTASSSDVVVESVDPTNGTASATIKPATSTASPTSSPGSSTVTNNRSCIEYLRHTIFRGTIPIHWTSEIPSGIGEAQVHFDSDPAKVIDGSEAYFKQVLSNMNNFVQMDAHSLVSKRSENDLFPSVSEDTLHPAVRCVNLLRQSSNPSEESLSRYFVEAVRKAVDEQDMGGVNALRGKIELAHVDWLNLVKEYKTEVAVSILWQNVVPFFLTGSEGGPSHGNAYDSPRSPRDGGMSPALNGLSPALSPRLTALSSGPAPPPLAEGRLDLTATAPGMSWSLHSSPLVTHGTFSKGSAGPVNTSVQSHFIRMNCADSLDRTNLGCFFTCLQALMEMASMINVKPMDFMDTTPIKALPGDSSDEDTSPAVDPQELAIDDEAFMMGIRGPPPHTSPPVGSPTTKKAGGTRNTNRYRAPFLRSWSDVRDPSKAAPALVRALSELFVMNGDTVAMMYTNSAALHSNLLRSLANMKLAKSNAVISAQRRFENVFEDRKKMRYLEILLGRNIELHLPSLSQLYLLRPLPYELWSWALCITGVPRGTRKEELEHAIRDLWDTVVVPHSNPQIFMDSSALCMSVYIEEGVFDKEALDMEAFLNTNTSVVFSSTAAVTAAEMMMGGDDDDNFCDVANCDYVAVVEFDEDTCRVVDVVRHILRHTSSITLPKSPNAPLRLAIYEFPLDKTNGSKSIATTASDAVKKAASSLRSGFKNLVRGLN